MYLSLCLIVKDENSYLQEWLDYHIILGVEHFWIYDNESAIPVEETLRTYIDSGWVTVNTIKGHAMQIYAYDHCLRTYGSESKWIGFIDTDEFIVPHSYKKLDTYLQQFESYAGFAISSLFFGYSGNNIRPIGGQITGYQKRTPERFSRNRFVKMIVQPERVIYPISPHSFLFTEDAYCVNENGMRVDAQEFPCHVNTIQINHYFSRSKQEWEKKMARGGGAGITYSDDRWLRVNNYADIEDTQIFDLLKRILPDAPKDNAAWKRINAKDSQQLIELLHKTALKIKPAKSGGWTQTEVIPRAELISYQDEMKKGMAVFEEGRFAEARDFWAKQITKFPFDPIRYTNFANVCIQLKDFQSAWNALAQAWRLAPLSLYVLLCMTDYFYAVGDYAQAEKTCLLVASQGDPQPEGIAIQALSQWKQGKIQEAIATAQPLIKYSDGKETNNPHIEELLLLIRQYDKNK
jgi:tetratricopeptide (TPR) repeat protein